MSSSRRKIFNDQFIKFLPKRNNNFKDLIRNIKGPDGWMDGWLDR